MKKLITLLFAITIMFSCSSDSSSDSNSNVLATTPLAQAEFDSSNLGIYKGVFTGSSGNITVNIMNDGNVNATLVLDGVSSTFTTTEEVSGNGDISSLTFTSGGMSFDIDISNNGETADVSALNIPGHPNAAMIIVKEYSDIIVKCYQGTFTGTSSGVFNIMTSENNVYGLVYPSGAEDAYYLSGLINETTILSGVYENGTEGGYFVGNLSGNTLNGTWESTEEQDSSSGNWSGIRTL